MEKIKSFTRDQFITYYGSDEYVLVPKEYKFNKNDFRGVWVSTVENIDINPFENKEDGMAQIDAIVATCKEYNLNAIIFQIRPTPRHILFQLRIAYECALGADGETVGLIHQRVLVGGQEDVWHKVFEQCSIPRCNSFIAFVLHQGLVKTEPMLVGRVTLRNGEETCEACLRSKIVVVIGQKGIVAAVVADAEHIQIGIIQLAEVGICNQSFNFSQQLFVFRSPFSVLCQEPFCSI